MSDLFKVLVLACSLVLAPQLAHAEWHGKVIHAITGQELAIGDMIQELRSAANVALAEKHYTPAVQAMQGRIIRDLVKATGTEGRFTTAWEFLNFSAQDKTDAAFGRFVAGDITVAEFLKLTQGSVPSDSYVPVLEATKELGGQLLGVNLSRAEKAPVVERGIGAADPKLVPPGFEMLGGGYFERFEAAMAGHATPEQIQNYFAAQCLTDDVMAFHITRDATNPLRFIVLGSFHAEYFSGTVERIRARSPKELTRVVRIIDASDFSAKELLGLIQHPKYGPIGDYVVFVNEPALL